jgi:hypothetical protein
VSKLVLTNAQRDSGFMMSVALLSLRFNHEGFLRWA